VELSWRLVDGGVRVSRTKIEARSPRHDLVVYDEIVQRGNAQTAVGEVMVTWVIIRG
jgi:hypothetical protein